jgi:DNA-binding HxlR family transcriptional regulator
MSFGTASRASQIDRAFWTLTELIEYGSLRWPRILDRVAGIRHKSLTATLRHLERDGSSPGP